ncbi:MAG: Adaptive-response sensory-kinase SasA [Legionellaceae bacterium]
MNVLLIEDTIEDAYLIKEMLFSQSYNNVSIQFFHKNNLQQGLITLQEQTFDLILCDLDLPDSIGLETFQAIYQQVPDTPIIVLTGNDDENTALTAVKNGAQDYLNKNEVNSKILLRAMRYAIERKMTEIALRESEVRFRSIVETTHEWIWAVNKEGYYTYTNPSIKNILGYESTDIIGKHFFTFVHEKDIPKLKKNLFHVQYNQQMGWTNLICRRRHQNQNYRYLESNCVPIFGIKGEIVGYQGCDRDITERKLAESWLHKHQLELARAARLTSIGEMATTIAHELNQPLAAIANFCQGCIVKLENGNPNNEELLKVMKLAAIQSERAGEIIHRMKNFVRKGTLYYETADINKVIMKAVTLIDYEMREKMVNIHFDFTECLPLIDIDKLQIEQVIINLIRNASEAMEALPITEKRNLTLQTNCINNHTITVTVKDEGPGFSEENGSQLFDIYFTTKTTGMGMGLSICRTIIEAHGGGINAKNNPDKGASFQFTLPIIAPKKKNHIM